MLLSDVLAGVVLVVEEALWRLSGLLALLGKLPVFLDNQEKGNYKVHLDPAQNGSDAAIMFNQSYDGDPEVVKWLRNRDFRHACALGEPQRLQISRKRRRFGIDLRIGNAFAHQKERGL